MKRKLIISASIIIFFAVFAFIIIDNLSKNSKLLSCDFISFNVEEKIYSGKKFDKTFSSYNLEISTLNTEDFKDINLDISNNAVINSAILENQKYIANFSVLNGTSVIFTFITSNYQTAIKSFNTTAYVSKVVVSYSDNQTPVNMQTENDNLILYNILGQNLASAKADGFYNSINYSTLVNDNAINEFEVVSNNSNIISVNNTENLLVAKAVGNAQIKLIAKDKSNYQEIINFTVKNIVANNIENLPNDILIDLAQSNNKAILYDVIPNYSTEIPLTFETTSNLITINNNLITANKIGTGTISVIFKNITIKTINFEVKDTSPQPYYILATEKEGISYANKTFTILYDSCEKVYDKIIFSITISAENIKTATLPFFSLNTLNITGNIIDTTDCIPAMPTNNILTLAINNKGTGTFTLKYSNNDLNIFMEETFSIECK